MVYDDAKKGITDADDVVLFNQNGEITETTIANIVIRKDQDLFTPPVSSGLLPGTFRAYLLEQGKIKERVITCGELQKADEIFLVNSLRKWRKAVLL